MLRKPHLCKVAGRGLMSSSSGKLGKGDANIVFSAIEGRECRVKLGPYHQSINSSDFIFLFYSDFDLL